MDNYFLKGSIHAVLYSGFVYLVFSDPDAPPIEISRLRARKSSNSTIVLVPRRSPKHDSPPSDTPLAQATAQETKAAEFVHNLREEVAYVQYKRCQLRRINAAVDGMYELLSDLAPAIAASEGLQIDGGTWKDRDKFNRVSSQCTELRSRAPVFRLRNLFLGSLKSARSLA